jgi:putative MATE family efflux protein
MSSPADVIDKSAIYLRIYFLGMPATMAYNFGAAILRAQGDTKRPLYFLIIAGVVNVILNLISVILLNMDVAGVALATTISQYVSAGLVILCLTKEDGPLRLNLKAMKLDRHILGQILEIGLPAGFQGIVFSLSNVLIQSSINSFGSTVVAGSAAAGNIENFVYQAMNAFYQTNLTFTGQNYGAGECRRVDKTLLYCQGFVILTGLILGNLAFFFGSQLLGIYAPGEPDVIQQGLVRMSYIGRLYAICGIMDTMVGILRGIGYSIVPMVVSLLGSCVLRLLWVWFVFPLDPVPGNLYISYPITWAITGAVHIIMFLAIRKKAYAKVQGSGPSYLSVDGHHPEATEH